MTNTRKDRIVLIGFRGCGKSTIGKKLAKMLGWEYISTDRIIEEKEKMPINEIVKRKRWRYFRKLESEVLSEMRASKNLIIDTGGGAVIEHQEEIDKLLTSSTVVWIDAYVEDIIRRLKDDKKRPLLNQSNFIEDIEFNYEKRRPVYQNLAAFKFNTSVESVEQICNKLILEMRQK